MTLNDTNDRPLPSLQALIARHGTLSVGVAYLRAALARRKHPPNSPADGLSDHLRRDIGLHPSAYIRKSERRGWDVWDEPLGKGLCFFPRDASHALAVKDGIPVGWGTDILFDARASEQQGRRLAHRKCWYTPAQALKLATAENTVHPEQVRPAPSLFRRSGCHPEGRPSRLAARGWRPDDDDPTQNLDLVADPDTNFTVIMKVGTGHKNTLWAGAHL
jgi:hypothetical protein